MDLSYRSHKRGIYSIYSIYSSCEKSMSFVHKETCSCYQSILLVVYWLYLESRTSEKFISCSTSPSDWWSSTSLGIHAVLHPSFSFFFPIALCLFLSKDLLSASSSYDIYEAFTKYISIPLQTFHFRAVGSLFSLVLFSPLSFSLSKENGSCWSERERERKKELDKSCAEQICCQEHTMISRGLRARRAILQCAVNT